MRSSTVKRPNVNVRVYLSDSNDQKVICDCSSPIQARWLMDLICGALKRSSGTDPSTAPNSISKLTEGLIDQGKITP